MKIQSIRARAVAAPMRRPLATSTGTLTASALLLLDLQTDAGITGRAYLFGIGAHNLKPIAALVEAMAEMVKGDPVAPCDIEKKLRQRYTLLGVHNIVLFAMAGIDMCAWDALGQALGQPLVRLLGGESRPVAAYNSNGLGIQNTGPLVKEAEALLAGGFSAVKLRLGRPEAKADLEALRAVKKVIEIPAEPADPDLLPPVLKGFKAVPPLVTDIDLSMDDKYLYVACWGTGDLQQYDVSDPFAPKLAGTVRIGGIVSRARHPKANGALNGGPQMVEISRDGKRIYFTNSLYGAVDPQFYPEGIDGWMVKLDAAPGGGIDFDPNFFLQWPKSHRPHQIRLQGGDCSSDSYCYP